MGIVPLKTELRDLQSKMKGFRDEYNVSSSAHVMNTVKKIIFEENGAINTQMAGSGKYRNFDVLKDSIRYVVENILELTPEQFDAIYSTTLIKKTCLDHPIRRLVAAAPPEIAIETLFSSKKTLFRICWPDYYKEHYQEPKPWDIFDAQGETRSGLIHAGRIKKDKDEEEYAGAEMTSHGRFSTKQDKKRMYGHGADVDRIVYWAMKEVLAFFEMKTPELFLALAKPKESGFGKFGFVAIIEARECYQTPLDFFMMNSPLEYQLAHFDEYIEARDKAGIPHLPAIDLIYAAYKHTIGKDNNYSDYEGMNGRDRTDSFLASNHDYDGER